MKISIHLDNHFYLLPFYRALEAVSKKFGFIIEDTHKIPFQSIAINDKIIGLIMFRDGFHINRFSLNLLKNNDYKILFKYHYSPNIFDYNCYGKYASRIVACGLYKFWGDMVFNKEDLLNRNRSTDVVALMRWYNKGTPPNSGKAWARARRTLIEQAKQLEAFGYKIKSGKKIPLNQYKKLLLDTKIGFLWSASAYLGWKIPEFTQQGVVMITEPLGENYPLINNTIFEDKKHCLFCNNPNDFTSTAEKLLKEKHQLEDMRANVLTLWEEKLTPEKVGIWIYNKLMEANNEN